VIQKNVARGITDIEICASDVTVTGHAVCFLTAMLKWMPDWSSEYLAIL